MSPIAISAQLLLQRGGSIFYSDFGFVRHGIFRLREPKGLEAIIKCKRSELFHEHPDVSGGIYTDTNGGHGGAVKVREMALEVIDLREK